MAHTKCHCFKKAIVDYLYTQSNLKDILDKENFSTCSLTYYSRNHIDPLTGRSSLESMETALNVCHNFVDTFSEEFHNILLYGDTGVGKDFSFPLHCKGVNGFSLFRYLLYSSRTFLISLQRTHLGNGRTRILMYLNISTTVTY